MSREANFCIARLNPPIIQRGTKMVLRRKTCIEFRIASGERAESTEQGISVHTSGVTLAA